MKILVTGAYGMLGVNLIKELVDREAEVVAFDCSSKIPKALNILPIDFFKGSILKKSDLKKAIKGCDAVIHTAAMVKTWPTRSTDFNEVNVVGTENLIEIALEAGIQKFIYVGSTSSFNFGTLKKPGTEKSPFKGFHYGLDYIDSKFYAQELVLNAVLHSGLPALVINPTYMIGPYDTRPGSGRLLLSFYKGQLKFLPPGGKNFVHTRDVAIAIANALTIGKVGACYIAGHENLSYNEFMQKAAKVLKIKPYGIRLPAFLLKLVGVISHLVANLLGRKPILSFPVAKIACDKQYFSPQKAVRELNMPQTPIETAMEEACDWFRTNGYCEGVSHSENTISKQPLETANYEG